MTAPAVDLHCHLDLYPDAALAAKKCGESGAYVLSVTTTPKAWRGTVRLAQGHDRIRTALGLHPQIAHERIGELALFDALLPETRYVGEVGLDGSPECKPHWREQVRVFDHVLASAAQAGGRIITIHSRRAATDVLDALARPPDAGVPILHWFSGTKAELLRAIEDTVEGRVPILASFVAEPAPEPSGAHAPDDPFSPRELEVLVLVAKGLSSKEAAEHLAISPTTVDTYRRRIAVKLGSRNRAALVRYAPAHGLLD